MKSTRISDKHHEFLKNKVNKDQPGFKTVEDVLGGIIEAHIKQENKRSLGIK